MHIVMMSVIFRIIIAREQFIYHITNNSLDSSIEIPDIVCMCVHVHAFNSQTNVHREPCNADAIFMHSIGAVVTAIGEFRELKNRPEFHESLDNLSIKPGAEYESQFRLAVALFTAPIKIRRTLVRFRLLPNNT